MEGATQQPTSSKWRSNFTFMSLVFSICQATVTTPIGFATSMLDPQVGALGTGVLDLVAAIAALMFGPLIVESLGPKRSLVAAEICSTTYALLFAWATTMQDGGQDQWVCYLVGAIAAGVGAGVLWTAQGVFFQWSNNAVATQEGIKQEDASAQLGGTFAMTLLLSEFFVKSFASLLQGKFLQWTIGEPVMDLHAMFFLFAGIAASMTFMMSMVKEPPAPGTTWDRPGVFDKVTAAFRLWSSPIIWCLGAMNVLFGFCAAYMNGFINGGFATEDPVFGTGSLGSLAAGTCLVAALCAKIFVPLSEKKGKGCVMAIGSVAFFMIPLSVLFYCPCVANSYWGKGLTFLYVLQGVGRGVYESTNKAVFSDFFPHDAAGAFANVRMQNSFGFFVSFGLQGVLPAEEGRHGLFTTDLLGYIVLALALMVMPCFALAWRIRRAAEEQAGKEPLLA